MATQQTAKTQYVSKDTTKYAYRRLGQSSKIPLVLFHHNRSSMDQYDPKLINQLAATREVILFDNAGVGQSTGEVASSVKEMSAHGIAFISALGLTEVDVLGLGLGAFVAPMVYLDGPAGLVRRIVIAGGSPSAGEGIVNPSAERMQTIKLYSQKDTVDLDAFSHLFFTLSEASQAAAREFWVRINERGPATSGEERSKAVSEGFTDDGKGLKAMAGALAKWADPAESGDGIYGRLAEIKAPVFVANGSDDLINPTQNSFALQQKLPHAYLKIYPDSGKAFFAQHADEFAADVVAFLDRA